MRLLLEDQERSAAEMRVSKQQKLRYHRLWNTASGTLIGSDFIRDHSLRSNNDHHDNWLEFTSRFSGSAVLACTDGRKEVTQRTFLVSRLCLDADALVILKDTLSRCSK